MRLVFIFPKMLLLIVYLLTMTACKQEGFKLNETFAPTQEEDNSSNNTDEDRQDNNNNLPTPTPTPNLPFFAGQAFAKNLITCTTDPKFIEQIDTYLTKENTPFKAIAVNAQLCGWVAMRSDFSSQADANRAALETCQIRTGNGDCAIFAEGIVVKYDPVDLNAALTKILNMNTINGGNFAGAQVPFVGDFVRQFYMGAYATGGNNKAMALALNGAGAYEFNQASQQAARDAAIASCEARSNGEPCIVVAVDNVFVVDQASIDAFNTQLNTR